MPMLRRIAAKGGAAGDIDDPPATAAVEEVRHREPRQVGRGLQVDGQRPRARPRAIRRRTTLSATAS